MGFALSATGYLAFKEHKSANPTPTEQNEPVIVSNDSHLVGPGIVQDAHLDEQGFQPDPTSGLKFMHSSKSLTIPESILTEIPPDVFLPSSKVRFVNPRVLTETEDVTEPVNN